MSSKDNVKQFWSLFLKHEGRLEKALDEDNKEETREIVHLLNDMMIKTCGCYLEVNKEGDSFYECTFLPMNDKTSQMFCAYLKKFAPTTVIDTWIINECVPPLSEKAFHMHFDLKDVSYGVSDLEVLVSVNEGAKNFDLLIFCPAFEWMEDHEANTILDAYLENMIGSLMVESRINEVKACKNKELGDWVAMEDLFEILSDLIIKNKWPEFNDITTIYSVYKIENDVIKETRDHDKMLITTAHPGLFVEICNNERFILDQCNRLGAEFGTISFQREYGDEKNALVKQQLERELNDLLYPLGIAKVLGGAIGLNYSYIDCLIFDRNEFKLALAKVNEKTAMNLLYQPM